MVCGPCDDRGGACINDTCKCNTGYVNNRLYFKFNDCGLPDGVIESIYIIALVLSVSAMLFCARVYKNANGRISKMIVQGAFWFAMFLSIMRIDQLIVRFEYHALTAFLSFAAFASSLGTLYLIVYSFIIPLYKEAKYSDKNLKRILFSSWVLFRCSSLTMTIFAVVSTTDQGWNDSINWFQFSLAMEGFCLIVSSLVLGIKIVLVVQRLVAGAPDIGATHSKAKLYLWKCKTMLLGLSILGPIIVYLYFYGSIQYLVTGYTPRAYLTSCIVLIVFPLAPFPIAIYAARVYIPKTDSAPGSSPLKQQQLQQPQLPPGGIACAPMTETVTSENEDKIEPIKEAKSQVTQIHPNPWQNQAASDGLDKEPNAQSTDQRRSKSKTKSRSKESSKERNDAKIGAQGIGEDAEHDAEEIAAEENGDEKAKRDSRKIQNIDQR